MHEHTRDCVREGADGAIRLTCTSPARLLVGAKTSAYATRQARDEISATDPYYAVMTFALELVIARGVRSSEIQVGDVVTGTLRGDFGREWTVVRIDGTERKVATLEQPGLAGMPPQVNRRYVSDLRKVRSEGRR